MVKLLFTWLLAGFSLAAVTGGLLYLMIYVALSTDVTEVEKVRSKFDWHLKTTNTIYCEEGGKDCRCQKEGQVTC